jgi:hypothetical protein
MNQRSTVAVFTFDPRSRIGRESDVRRCFCGSTSLCRLPTALPTTRHQESGFFLDTSVPHERETSPIDYFSSHISSSLTGTCRVLASIRVLSHGDTPIIYRSLHFTLSPRCSIDKSKAASVRPSLDPRRTRHASLSGSVSQSAYASDFPV